MLSDKNFTYYQPQAYYDDGTNINYGSIPEELFSFQAFPTREECEEWLRIHNYNPGEFAIIEYHDEDIEEVTLIDHNGDIIPKIEDFSDDEVKDMLTDEVLFAAGSIDNLKEERQDDETKGQYMKRVYAAARDEVNDAIVSIEESGEYNFQSYCGTPDVEWYDKAIDEAVKTVFHWMTGTDE